MTGAFVFGVAGSEMRAVIAGIHKQGIFRQPQSFQFVSDTAHILIQAVNAAEIIRIFFPPITFGIGKVAGNWEILEAFPLAVRPFIVIVIVLMMGLDVRHKQKERLFTVAGLEIFQHPIGLRIRPVAAFRELPPVHIGVKHVSVITVRREFQRIGCQPEVFVTAAPFGRNRTGTKVIGPVVRAK